MRLSPHVAALLLLAAPGCRSVPEGPPAPAPAPQGASRCTPVERRRALDDFLAQHRAAYEEALAGARGFLDALEVDPLELRAHRIKGKKKLVEALDAYARLHQVAAPEARAGILVRVKALAAVTYHDRYHDMLRVDDRTFKEDATSYLRAALLLDRMGLDTARYRVEMSKAKPRLDAHMQERGPHQRRAFHQYYQHFGLAEPFPLGGALEQGIIARRADPAGLSRMEAYGFTHEIFTAYEFGERLDAEPFGEADRGYLTKALPQLTEIWLGKRDVDLVAELVACQRYARMTGETAYLSGLRFLLAEQNADGSWGRYESSRARLGEYVKQGLYLHTVMVTIEALTSAFEEVYRRGEGPVCP